MKKLTFLTILLMTVLVSTAAAVQSIEGQLDGVDGKYQLKVHPQNTQADGLGRAVDVVGGTDSYSSGTGMAKGNAYRVDVSVILEGAQFYLDFTGTQNLTWYIFICPTEFGEYIEFGRETEAVTGTGASWYGPLDWHVALPEDNFFIIAVSWDGYVTYFYNEGDSQATSFGEYVSGYAIGLDPLPASIIHEVNDQAIYYQTLTIGTITPADDSSLSAVKALY